jgi:hypothetical protein
LSLSEKVKVTLSRLDFFLLKLEIRYHALNASHFIGIVLRYSLCNKFGSGFNE